MSAKAAALAVSFALTALTLPHARAIDAETPATRPNSVGQKNALATAEIEQSLVATLQTIRCQLELYRIQHNDKYPTFAQMVNWTCLTATTDATGECSQKGFGPYVQDSPVNPLTNKSAIAASGSATKDYGWTYDQATGRLRAVIPAGVELDKTKFGAADVEVVQ